MSDLFKNLSDTLALSESRGSGVDKILADVLSLADTNVSKNVAKALSDILSLSDVEVKQVSKALNATLTLSELAYVRRILKLVDTVGFDDFQR